ncbi:TetR/AcrR family transcriptional regulator [Natribacillus halophilus]|uniref:DNA-binding transcriptional regulator, AcrR family n=1 Tax=Natribacillus halophilus TaxID=549003 RepID=A0A1G8KVV8_9BACI|nr:TetR/AcrR family transcriptional regulator [Natribacillus halophilus]SDI47503.1 DNA-binding transcriptional regulator, AcrR family [Natribacillus halophilus]
MDKKQVPAMVKDEQLIQKRRDQMVRSAVKLFQEKGFHRTTTREIARSSGFSVGTLYEYIGAKEDILYLVCDAVYDEVTVRFNRLLDQSLPAAERFRHMVTVLFQVMDEMQDEVLVMYQEAKSLPKESLRYVLKKDESMTADIRKMIHECRDEGFLHVSDEYAHFMAENITVKGHMWTFRRWALRKHYTLEEYTRLQLDMLLSKTDAKI